MDQIRIPVSVGELFDKLSILDIKIERIADNERRENVKREYDLLNEISRPLRDKLTERGFELVRELRTINIEIWNAENQVRRFERQNKFESEYIDVARRNYKNNDRRAALKRELNAIFGSTIVEEKEHS